MLDDMPSLLEDARGVVPNMLEACAKDYKKCMSRGVYLKHLDVETNLRSIDKALKEDQLKLRMVKQMVLQNTWQHIKNVLISCPSRFVQKVLLLIR